MADWATGYMVRRLFKHLDGVILTWEGFTGLAEALCEVCHNGGMMTKHRWQELKNLFHPTRKNRLFIIACHFTCLELVLHPDGARWHPDDTTRSASASLRSVFVGGQNDFLCYRTFFIRRGTAMPGYVHSLNWTSLRPWCVIGLVLSWGGWTLLFLKWEIEIFLQTHRFKFTLWCGVNGYRLSQSFAWLGFVKKAKIMVNSWL